jgi:oligosaccharide repeat unit polymerase
MLYSAFLVRFDPLHPVVWLSPFLFLYHFSVVILSVLNIRELQFAQEIIRIGWISIFVCSVLAVVLCSKNLKFDYEIFKEKYKSHYINQLILILYIFCLILVLLHNVSFLSLGIQTKAEATNSNILPLYFAHNWLTLCYTLILARELFTKRKFPLLIFCLTFTLSIFSTLNLGERNIILSFLISTIFITYYYYKPRKVFIFGLAGILVLLISFLGTLKNLFTRQSISLSSSNVFTDLFSGEFISAGRNLEYIFQNPEKWSYFYGETLIWDLIRSIVPGSIYRVQSTSYWYNITFHPTAVERGQGYGFSLSAEGYLNFGIVGVVIWMMIAMVLLSYLYNKAKRSIIWFSVYILSIPYFIYSIRGDLSSLLSPILKSVLLVFLLLFITGEILIGSVNKNKEQRKYHQ